MDNILFNLNIIANLKPNQKINTSHTNSLHIEIDSPIQGFVRCLKRDGRMEMLDRITNVINESKNIIDYHINIKHNVNNKHSNDELCNLSNGLFKSLDGIVNLKITYRRDTVVVSRLEVIHECIKRLLLKINSNLERNNQ
jgi:hypothetical protein